MSTINEALKRAADVAGSRPVGPQVPPPAEVAAPQAPPGPQPAPGGSAPQGSVEAPQAAPAPAAAPVPLRRRDVPRWVWLAGIGFLFLLLAYGYTKHSSVVETPSAQAEPHVWREKIVDDRARLLAECELPVEVLSQESGAATQGGSAAAKAPEADPAAAPAVAPAPRTGRSPLVGRPAASPRRPVAGRVSRAPRDAEADDEESDDEDQPAPSPAERRRAAKSPAKSPARGSARGAAMKPAPLPQRPPGPVPVAMPNRIAPGFRPAGSVPLPASQFAYNAPQPVQPPVARPVAPPAAPPAPEDLSEELLRQAKERETQNQPEQAAALYALVLDKQPSREAASVRLGNLLFRQKKYDEAEKVFRKAVETKESALLHNNLGNVYLAQKKLDLARQAFVTAAALDAKYPDPHYNLACYYALSGKPKEGLQELERAKALKPEVMQWAEGDGDLAPVRQLPEYKRLTQ